MNRRRKRPNWFGIILLCLLVLGGAYVDRFIVPFQPQLGVPSPTPTRSPESVIAEAEGYFKDGKLIPAINSYKEAIATDPENPAAYIALARIQVWAGQYKDAEESARSAILLNNDNSMAHAVLGWTLGFEGNYIEAENSIKTALTLDANNALAHAYYVEILVDSGSFDVIEKAIEESKVAVALAPDALETHRARGIIHEAVGEYDDAILEYQQAIAINPKIADLYLGLGRNFRAKQFYDDAITAFGNANSLNPDDPMPDYFTSRTLVTIGKFTQAMQYAQTAVENSPADANLRGNLGVMYYLNAFFDKAIVELGYAVNGGITTDGKKIEAYPLVPNDVHILDYYTKYGLALAKLNKCSEALDIARTLSQRLPDDENAVFNANAIVNNCQKNLEQTPVPLQASLEPVTASPTATASTETPTPAQ